MKEFDPYQLSECPICKEKLTIHKSDQFSRTRYEIHECEVDPIVSARFAAQPYSSHYFVSLDKDGQPIKSEIRIPGFLLMYVGNETSVFKYESPLSQTYHYVTTLDQHFPLDFSDLNKASERLNNLIVFS